MHVLLSTRAGAFAGARCYNIPVMVDSAGPYVTQGEEEERVGRQTAIGHREAQPFHNLAKEVRSRNKLEHSA